MFEVMHRRAADGEGGGWIFDCPALASIEGGGRTYLASVAAAEHAARHYLSRENSRPAELDHAVGQLRHVVVPETAASRIPQSRRFPERAVKR